MIGVPVPGGMNYQPAVTEVAHDMHWLSHWVHGIMAVIVLFVVALLGDRDPALQPAAATRSRRSFTHNTRIEIAWTLVPVVILILIGSFSLPILFKQLEVPPSDLTIKATGNQWYWTYDYPGERVLLRQPDAGRGRAGGARLHPATCTCSPPTPPWWCRWARSCTCR